VSISLDEVRHIAALARLGISDERAELAAHELSSILAHMQVLARVDDERVNDSVADSPAGMMLRPDAGPPIPLLRAPAFFAPEMREGFFLVPRLATHEDPEQSP
jgi:aspartyl-tRNA(Asn)/glutamyl-tRNA(Gln) amidotransferase subunit C